MALSRRGGEPLKLGLDEKARPTVDFRRDVQPLLDRHCVACHSGPEAAAGLSLTGEETAYYSNSYESLMHLEDPESGWYGRKKYVSERDGLAVESYLIEKVYGRELEAPRPLSGDAPHPSPGLLAARGIEAAPLDDADRLLLVRWIDLGASFLGAPGAPPADGPPLAGAARRQRETGTAIEGQAAQGGPRDRREDAAQDGPRGRRVDAARGGPRGPREDAAQEGPRDRREDAAQDGARDRREGGAES